MDTDETINLQDYVSAADAARSLKIALTTLRGAVEKGRLPATTVLGRIYIKQADLEAYRTRTRGPGGEKPRGRPSKSGGGVSEEDSHKATLEAMALENPLVRRRLGERIRKRRAELGISQVALADLMGVQRASMSQYESGTAGLDAAELPRLAKVLETTPNYLFGVDAMPPIPEGLTGGALYLYGYWSAMSEAAQAQALHLVEAMWEFDTRVLDKAPVGRRKVACDERREQGSGENEAENEAEK